MKLFTRINYDTVRQTLQIYKEEMRAEKKILLLVTICIPLGQFLYIVLLPFLISLITQSVLTHPKELAAPLWMLAAMAAVSVVTLIVSHFGYIALFNHEERVTTRLTKRAISSLLAHSHGFFANQKVGSLAGDVHTFSHSYVSIMDTMFLQAGSIIVNFITSLIIVAFIAPIMLIPLVALTAFVVLHSFHSVQGRAVYRNQRKEMQSRLHGTIADILGNHTLVRLFGKQASEVGNVVRERRAIEGVAEKEIVILQRNAEVRQGVLYLFQIATIGLCAALFSQSLLSVASFIFIITYLGRITGSMFNIGSIMRNVEQSFLDASKITEILATTPEVRDHKTAIALTSSRSAITFSDVTFSYDDNTRHAVFDHLNLHIPAGQRIGLVGKSGGGKTTLTSLLLRYMDIDDGHIYIDDQDISHVTQSSLRDAISYVPQESYLFHRTIRENISYGAKDTSEEAIAQALRQANAYDFVMELPHGLDTLVGERGVKLSGGQRQRIAIARAILKDAPILVLDEATSALDSESEKLIQDALGDLMDGRTSIVIAHRLSTIAKLDRIIVLDRGNIVEDGTHAELLARDGLYAALWKRQSGGFINEDAT